MRARQTALRLPRRIGAWHVECNSGAQKAELGDWRRNAASEPPVEGIMLVPSHARVPRNTPSHLNQRIANATAERLRRCAVEGADGIDRRLVELDREWDIERTIETAAPIGILLGIALGLARDKRFLGLPIAIASFLLLHGVQGWAPPLPLLRRLGRRTTEEIDEERYALRALRGDFRTLPDEPEQYLSLVKH
jgi:hypothetical protein